MATLKEVYNAFKADGAPLPDTYEEFEKYMTSGPNKGYDHRKEWYDAYKADGAPLPDTYEEFSKTLFHEEPSMPMAQAVEESSSAPTEVTEQSSVQPQKPWQPSLQDRLRASWDITQGVNNFKQGNKAAREKVKRQSEMITPEGRQKAKVAKASAKLVGANVETPLFGGGGNADGSAAPNAEQQNAAPTQSPQVAGVKFQDGKPITEWMLPDGTLTTDRQQVGAAEERARASRLQHEFEGRMKEKGLDPTKEEDVKKQADYETVGRELEEAYQEKEALEAALNKRKEELDKEHDNVGLGTRILRGLSEAVISSKDPHAIRDDSEARDYTADKQYNQLMAAIRHNRQAINILEDKRRNKMNEFWLGLGKEMVNGYTFDYGKGQLDDSRALNDAADLVDTINEKRRKGEALNEEEHTAELLLTSLARRNSTEGRFGGDYGAWARAGKMASHSIELLPDFAMGGMSLMQSVTTKSLAKMGLKEVAKGFGNKVMRATGIGMGALAGGIAMTNTIQAPRLLSETAKNYDGQLYQDADGNFIIDGKEGFMTSFLKAQRNLIAENASEAVGAFLPGAAAAGALVSKGLEKIGLSKLNGALTSIGNKQWYQNTNTALKQMGFNGTINEGLEEYAGIGYQALMADRDALGSLTDMNTHVDIWLGTVTMGALLNTPQYIGTAAYGAQYAKAKHGLNKNDKAGASVYGERWEGIKSQIDGLQNENVAGVLTTMLTDGTASTKEERQALLDYASSLQRMRGLNIGQMMGGSPQDAEVAQTYSSGYEASTPQEMVDAQNMYEYQRQRLVNELGSIGEENIENILAEVESDPVGALNKTYDPALRDIVMDYANAKTVRDGMIQRVNDDIDEQIAQSNAMINGRINKESGLIVPATMGLDDRLVYVVSGNIIANDDGSIDRDASDEIFIVRDAQTGKLEWSDPRSLSSLGEAIDPEEERATATEAIRQQHAQSAVDAMNGTLAFNSGDVVQINDGENAMQATIVGPAVDEKSGMPVEGQVVVQLPDGQQTVFTKEQLQAFADAANLERINSFEQERAAARAQQQLAEAEAKRPKFALNDEFTILDEDGNPIRGSITGELDDDGTIEIYTENPVNGKLMNRLTSEELEGMLDTYNGEQLHAVPIQEQTSKMQNEAPNKLPAAEAAAPNQSEEIQPTALSRIPVDEEGEPLFDQTDPATAWDGMTEYFGDADDAIEFARSKVKTLKNEKDKLVKAVSDIKATGSAKEFKEAKTKARAQLAAKQAQLDHWNNVVNAKIAKEQAEAEARRQAEEAERERNRQAYLAAESERRQQEEVRRQEQERKATLDAELAAEVERQSLLPETQEQTRAANSFDGYIEQMRQEILSRGAGEQRQRLNERIRTASGAKQYGEIYAALSEEQGPAASLEEWVTRALSVNKQRVKWTGEGNLRGQIFAAGKKEKVSEVKQLQWMISDREGIPFWDFVHKMWETLSADDSAGFNREAVTDQDVRNMVIEVLRSHPTSRSLFDSAIEMYDIRTTSDTMQGELQQMEHDMDDIRDEWYSKNLGMTYDEYNARVEAIYSEIRRSELTDEDIDAINSEIAEEQQNINDNGTDYERALRSSAESVQAEQSDGRAGDASTDVDRPETTGRGSDSESGSVAAEEIQGDGSRPVLSESERGGQGDVSANQRRYSSDLSQAETERLNYQLSDEVDDNGRLFVLNSNGELEFGRIDADTGLKSAPILLSEGVITNTKTNDGYGLLHIAARHGNEIRKAGYSSVLEFIEDVAQHWEIIREGKDRNGNQTYRLIAKGKHNKTIMVELSGDGSYWNINTAGIFKTSYGKNAKEIYHRHTTVEQPAEAVGESQDAEQSGTTVSSRMSSSKSSIGKDNALLSDKQGDSEKSLPDRIAAAEAEVNTEPTDAQKEAGNYKMGHVKIDGLDISIENPKGSIRSGKDANGNAWETKMNNTYGYICGTTGVDGDKIDVFLSENPAEGDVYVVDQYNPDGSFDEHKIMYGFASADEAKGAYLSNYSADWADGRKIEITGVTREEFRKWLDASDRKTKPFAEYKSVKPINPSGNKLVTDNTNQNQEIVSNNGEKSVSLKQWSDMNGGERIAYAERNPLTKSEIESFVLDSTIKANALAYLDGRKGIIQELSYLNVYEHVRNTNRDSSRSSSDEDETQLAGTRSSASDGRGEGDAGRGDTLHVDNGAGTETLSTVSDGRADSEGDGRTPFGERGGEHISSEESPVEDIHPGDIQSDGSRNDRSNGGNGRNGRRKSRRTNDGTDGERKSSPRHADNGTTDVSVEDELKDALTEFGSILDDFLRAGRGELSISIIGMNSRQLELMPKVISAGAKVGYALIKRGITKFKEWGDKMHTYLSPAFNNAGLSESEIDAWISEMWDCDYTIDGETHRISEWASIEDGKKLRHHVGLTLEDKRKAQEAAESIKVITADSENIRETLPFLLPQQQEDVRKAEVQFFDESHADAEHGNGKGYMFTNGTGTGKTYTGLGIVKRFVKQGKGRILILTPSQPKVTDWINDGRNLGLHIRSLDDWSKERGSTATTEKGDGVVITTYANFRQNSALGEDCFDLIVYDESHRLLENKKGEATAGVAAHYRLSNKDENYAFGRLRDTNAVYNELIATRKECEDEYARAVDMAKEETGQNNVYHLKTNGYIPPAIDEQWSAALERKFPKLAALRTRALDLQRRFNEEEKPRIETQAKEDVKRTKVVFLSATPFNSRENIDYAEGYLFSYPKDDNSGYNVPKGRSRFFLDHFGAGYKWRYHRLERSTENADALSRQEVEFSDWLQNDLQTMSGRVIDSEYDYSRDFPTVTGEYAERFNEATSELAHNNATWRAYHDTIGSYNYAQALFESMKVSQIIPRIKAHIEVGRKVAVYHRRVEASKPLEKPFALLFAQAEYLAASLKTEEKSKAKAEIRRLKRKYADMLEWEKSLDLRMPREQLAETFGEENIGFFGGKESTKVKNKAVEEFNADNNGKNILVVQEASGKEGISLHDRTGKHQRVVITLALPQSPITALQIEGRIFRIGNRSNAIFEYPLLGLDSEMVLFGQQFNNQVGTTENLALGSKARNLRESFIKGLEEHSGDVPLERQGIGGKELDTDKERENISPFDRAVLDYYTNHKISSSRNQREGADYYPTPEPLGYMMTRWGRISEGESVLEPSAGHGAIARYVPTTNTMTAIEPSASLFSRLLIKAGGAGRKFENTTFENYNLVNKHDVVLMNPPFGTAGRLAVDHVAKAFNHLEEGGRIVAIIPRGSTDKKFEQWYDSAKNAVMTGEVILPDITFERAGTSVNCRVVILDKVSNKKLASQAISNARHIDLSGYNYDKVEDFFDSIRDIDMPNRTIDRTAILRKRCLAPARALRELKGIRNVEVGDDYISINGSGLWERISWGHLAAEDFNKELRVKFNNYSRWEANAAERQELTKAAIYADLKGLCARLSGKTEEEMERGDSQPGEAEDGILYRTSAEIDAEYPNWLNGTTTDSGKHTTQVEGTRKTYGKLGDWIEANLGKDVAILDASSGMGYGTADLRKRGFNIEDVEPYQSEQRKANNPATYDSYSKIDKQYDYIISNAVLNVVPDDWRRDVLHDMASRLKAGGKLFINTRKAGEEKSIKDKIELDSPQEVLVKRNGKIASYQKFFTPKELKEWVASELGEEYDVEIANEKNSGTKGLAAVVVTRNENINRMGDGYGAYSDAEVSYLNDTASKLAGKNRFSKKRQTEFAARERQRMADRIQELAEHLHLNNVEVLTDTSQLEGKRAEAKGFFNKRTGKITIVLPNNYGKIDAEQTLLHEAVAHYGLRKLFGKHFDTFLNNVYESAEPEIRRKIAAMAAKYGWDFRTATEEYLAGLAEDTNFDEARAYGGWWSRIKRLFLDMLEKIGFEGFRDNTGIVITDNELRYLLWRSYENLRGRDKGIFRDAADVVKQVELKVGNYAEGGIEADYAAEPTDVGSINAQFNQELQQYENGTLPKGHRFELGMPSAYLRSAGFPNLPISMRSTLLATKAKMNRHPFDALNLKGLVEALQKPIAIFEYSKPNMRNLIVDVKRGDKHFLVGVTLNYKAGDIEINSVSGLFPKDSLEWLKWIQDGKAIRIDQKEKVQAIIDSQRTTNTVESERIGLNLDDAAKIVKSFENPTVEGEELFRPGDFTPRDKALARDEYERIVSRSSFQAREAIQDSMLGLKELYKAISESEASAQDQEFRIEEIAGFENAYLFENRMSSINAAEQHEYFSRYMNPLLEEIGKIAGVDERKRRDLTDYMMAKHGLERNEYMRNEAAANGEETERDFAGLTGLTGEADWRTAEATTQQWVDDYEAATDTSALWQAVNKATQATLERIYHSGIISKENYEKILGMYQYYVPLRGWDEKTSEEVYGYLMSKDGPLGGSIMKKAEGRSSKADDPIATIAMMADDAIRQGNRNLMKQRFLNFILNHPSDAVSVHDIWLEYDDVTDEWRPVFADVNATDTADEVARKVEAFEQRMEALQKNEPDKYKRGREAQQIPYKVVNNNLREHQVLIKRNGRTFVATINGNPRAAQAINGLTNPDVDQNGIVGNMLKAGSWLNRQLSAFYTTRNPDFVVGNFFRDTLYSNCMTWVKESPRYALRFHKNFGHFNPVTMRRLLGKWENGTLDMSNRVESMFYQFMRNGGETGYTNIRDIDSHKKAVAAELKKQGNIGRKAWSVLGMQLDLLNRSAENSARFAAFVTSREFGRSIDRSIYDAKEVSVNFNKKGSGGKMVNAVGQTTLGKAASYLGGGGRLLYVFWNAGIQGMTNFSRQAKRHPAKFMVGASALFTLGYIIPVLAEMLGGGDGDDDDKNAYYNLPEYVRRSNICFRAGGQWITIPLPIEYRAMYGMGELAHGVISGNERYSNFELAYQMASQVSQILPLDMLEGGGGFTPLIPSVLKPVTEAYIMNRGWTGLPVYKDTPFNKNEPEWTKAYASTDKHLVSFAKWLNETTGGDDFTKGAIDINPAKIEYLLNGTFGGLFTFPNKVKKTGETMFGDRDFEWRNIPIANRLIKSGDERTAFRKLQNEYFKYKEESEETARRWRKYQKADEVGLMGYAEKVDFLENSPEYLRYEIFGDFKDDIAAIKEAREAEPNETKAKSLEAEYYGTMRELVDALHDPNSYFKKLYDAGQLNDEYVKFLEKHHGIKLRDAK